MADKKDVSVEGSAARAADRGRDQLGFGEGNDSRPSLGDPSVVADLVADFCLEVIEARTKYLHDEVTADDAKDQIRLLARLYGNIIMGDDPNYATNAWHSPERLGQRILKMIAPVKGISDPGEQLFVTLGASVTSISVALANGRLSDAEAKSHLDALQDQIADLIAGVFSS